jgi:electron transfer flavoprotein beta subunit
MKILVALKQVAARDSVLKPAADSRWIDETDMTYEINEPDAYALEAGLQLKEQHGGEVVVLAAGPARVSSSIREALAKGADRAIHIEQDGLDAWDSLSLARLLAAAARTESPDVVLTGLQSDDAGRGETGVMMAELLGVAHATIVMKIDVEGGALKVKRELEGGWFQDLTVPMPAVLAVQSGINKLRYATLMGIKKARTKEVKVMTAAGLGVESVPLVVLERLASPVKKKQGEMIEGTPKEQAATLIEKLRFEARAI